MSDGVSNDYIESLGMSAEDYAKLSDDEQQAAIDSYVDSLEAEGKSAEEIEEQLSELKADLEAIADMYDEYAEELEDLETGDMSDSEKENVEELIETCENIIEEMNEGEERVDDGYDNYVAHNKNYDSNESAYVSDLTYDGQTYVYDMNGGDVYYESGDATLVSYDPSTGTIVLKVTNPDNPEEYCYVEIRTHNTSDPFASGDESDEDYLKEEGVTNDEGEVIQDVNADGFMNQDDIDAALEARDGSTLEDGKTQIYFSSGISSDDLETMKTTWPNDLLKMCYWGDSTKSFYEELYETDDEEESNLGVIEGYSDAVSGLTSSSVSSYTDGSLGELQDEAEAALETLFGYLDDPSQDLTDVWGEIFEQWAGLSDDEKALLLQYMTVTVALNAKDHFATLFGPMVSTIEEMLHGSTPDDYSVNDKVIILLLETQAGVGKYGGATAVWTTAMSPDGTTDGKWSDNEENVEAIGLYQELIGLMGGVPTGYESDTMDREEALTEGEAETEEAGGTVTDDIWNYSSVYGQVGNYGDTYANDMDWTDGVDDQILTSNLTTLVNGIENLLSDGEATVEEIVNYIISTIGSLPANQQDDTATALCALLHDKANDLFKKLKANDDFVGYMDGLINNRNNNPHNYKQVREWLGLSGKN